MREFSPERPEPTVEEIEALLSLLVDPFGQQDRRTTSTVSLYDLTPSQLAPAVQRVALRLVAAAWTGGWQPAEIHRQIARATNKTGARLALGLIANDHTDRDPARLDPRWVAQLRDLGVPARPDPDWIVREAGKPTTGYAFVETMLKLLYALGEVRPIPILIPPPGAGGADTVPIDLYTSFDSPMLERVRALLAKAESTEFEAEAEAFTAKAHELMARHSIDIAMLAARASNPDAPTTVRLPIDNPYADAKVLLLQTVAQHCGARSVFLKRYALASVVGFAGDVAATEILFTSLLVQAQSALQQSDRASTRRPGSTRSFRSSFLMAYATRIGERLGEVNRAVRMQAESDTGCSLTPVLATRDAKVRDAVEAQFGRLTMTRLRGGRDPLGWTSGRLAADRADLHRGDLSAGPST